jgi:hypothetical protein
MAEPGIQDYVGRKSIVNPETEMDWKSEELPKIIDT